MNTQGQQFFDSRTLQIAILAALAAALMVGAAFFFGTGLYADTQQSVAPSPIGSSLTAVREFRPVAPSPIGSSLTAVREVRSVAASPLGSSLTAVREVRPVARSPLGSSLTAVRGSNPSAESLKALEERWAPFYAGLDKALKDAGARP